jgi:predicted  nucleic acid-binding Zn-ribbon protein|tara:strand:- start:993 stop:1706 length:714 start_codon:yes stop_codon:yes gene_type:complete
MTAMEDLFALQDEDVLRGQLEYRRARLPEADAVLAAEAVRVQMSAEVGDLQIQRLDHARRQNRFEGEVASIEVRLGELDQRLYGSAITSPKEATALQNEIGSLRRRQDDLEGQILEIMEILEPTDARLEELAAAAIVADADIAAAKVALVETEAAIDGELAESATRREAAVQSLPADVLVRYQRSLPSFGASTVVRFSGTDCSGCPYSMPSMEADRVKGLDAGTLAECSECGRLVVR